MKERISFCIPCYQSEKTIIKVIEEINQIVRLKPEYDCEIITVVDGSPDNVFDVLKEYAKKYRNVKVINLSKNFSQANARMATLFYATGDYLVCMDDDGQCPTNEVWKLLEPLFQGVDVSIASYPKKKQSLFKNFGSYINNKTIHFLMDVPKGFKMSNYFAIKKYVKDKMLEYKNPYPYITGLISRTTNNFEYVEMEERNRIEGSSGYTFRKLIKLWLNGFTAFSVIPLRVSSFIGALCAVVGFIFGIVTIIRKFTSNISVGWTSTIAIMLFIGGLIMLMLGMIGEYIGRIYISINDSPQFVVRDTINVEDNEKGWE